MYEFIRGAVVSRNDGAVVLETAGVGYRLQVSASTHAAVPPEGNTVLFAHHLVRDDRAELFGFATETERHLFRQLLAVSGVGPAAALGLLSAYEAAVLASHIASGDAALLTRVKGIGKRTAERVIVELRDKLAKGVPTPPTGGLGAVRADAVLALCSLGLPRAEAEKRVEQVEGDGLELEEIVRQALRP
ncbi:MAG: Holliday junction branch migration protein RuvA [Planctomycetota bacterium]